VSEENLVAIRKRGGEYLVGTTRSKLKQFEQELLKDDFEKIRPDVEVKQIQIPGGEETVSYAGTEGEREGHPQSLLWPRSKKRSPDSRSASQKAN
jgi:hypothetical protein